jgi:hypothetical protein
MPKLRIEQRVAKPLTVRGNRLVTQIHVLARPHDYLQKGGDFPTQ